MLIRYWLYSLWCTIILVAYFIHDSWCFLIAYPHLASLPLIPSLFSLSASLVFLLDSLVCCIYIFYVVVVVLDSTYK